MGDDTLGTDPTEGRQELSLRVDDRGRVTIPKEVRDQLGIDPGDEVPGRVVGSVLKIDPNPSSKLQFATSKRTSWEHSTPMDAGETLFGTTERQEQR